jgi:hypothetical protein
MIEIKDLLLKFNNILNSEEYKKKSICETISSVIGVKIETENIKIKNNIVYLNIRPIYKNEIFLKRDLIDTKLKEILGKKIPQEFR